MFRKAAIVLAAAITGGAAIGWGSDAAHLKALTNERHQLSEEFALEIPRGAPRDVIEAAFLRRGWKPDCDRVLKACLCYGDRTSRFELGETGFLVKVSFDDAEIASDIEIKLIYTFL